MNTTAYAPPRSVALPQSRVAYDAPSPLYLPPAARVSAAPAPAAQPAVAMPAPTVAPAYAAAPRQYSPAAVPPAPVIAAPEAETRALTIRERVAVFGNEAPPQNSGGRQFRVIEVAEASPRQSGPFDAPARKSSAAGVEVATAEPFSIPTTSSGTPYYQNGTPPAIEYFIPHIPQEEPLWCWAAAAQQAIGWVNKGRAPAQCAIVALAHGLDVQECCNDREGICARTGEIPAIEKLVERFGGQAQELATVPRDPQVVYDILRRGDTLLIRLRPAPHDEAVGIRHMIMVRGIEWLRLPNNQLQATLLYNDPLGAGERAVNFDEIEGFFEQALVITRI